MLLPFLLSLLIIRRLVIQNTQGNRRLVSLISKWLSRIADQRFSPLFHVRKDLFRSVCRDSKDPEKCRLYVERLELASLNIVH